MIYQLSFDFAILTIGLKGVINVDFIEVQYNLWVNNSKTQTNEFFCLYFINFINMNINLKNDEELLLCHIYK